MLAQAGMQSTILFVEDNKALCNEIATVLELEGYTVQVAYNGREALAFLENGFLPSVIVSDIMMPIMDGYEFFRAVRRKKSLKTVPFIFLTALSSQQEVSVGRLLGVDDYLIKPLTPEELLIAIQTRLRRTTEVLTQANDSLQDARRTLVELLSHELWSPLSHVTGGLSLLIDTLHPQFDCFKNKDVRISLDLIKDGTQRLTRLAEQMELYSRILSDLIPHQIETSGEYLELPMLVCEARNQLSDLAQARGISFLQTMPTETTVSVYGIRLLLISAISEVLRNAIQYSPNDAPIKITLTHDETFTSLTIADSGEGINPEHQTMIWDILIQSERDLNAQQGAGMGLPIAKGIITAHGGDVALHSVPGQGTEITLRLPLTFPPP